MNKQAIGLVLVLFLLTIATACGSGGDSDDGTIQSGLSAGFTPDEPSPGPNNVAMAEGSSTGDLVTVEVNVSDTDGVYGAAFDVPFNPTDVTYDGFSKGTFFEQGGHTPIYQVTPHADELIVSVTRQGNVSGASTSTAMPVIRLRFRVKKIGGHSITFQNSQLMDDQVQPQPLTGIQWFGGTLTGI